MWIHLLALGLIDGGNGERRVRNPAGSSKKRKKNSFYVEIDDEVFIVNSHEEAKILLNQAISLAKEVAPNLASKKIITIAHGKKIIPRINVRADDQEYLSFLQKQLSFAQEAIEQIYLDAVRAFDVMLKNKNKNENDELILLLNMMAL